MNDTRDRKALEAARENQDKKREGFLGAPGEGD